GDFDNDMDEDIYVVTANQVINEPNIFYENQGDGTFIAREDALGAADLNLGIGDSVTTADYNLDGFLDLFVTNGRDLALLNEDGAVQLFENQGNSNHWLAIDLEGIISNRDGVGAKVYVTAGGKTQLKQQTGGIHNRSQNHSRLHVGLGSNETVEEIIVEWTSGIVQTINDVPADQLIQIVEPKIFFTPHKPVAPGNSRVLSWQDIFKDLENGVKISGYTDSASGAPNYDLNQEGLFIWQDDAGWHLRATGDITGTRYQGSFKTDGADFSVSRINLEDNDIITQPNPQQLDFDLRVLQGFEDGIDFNLPENSSLTLDLGDRTQGLDLVRIGAEQLSIDAL
ncbi:MAG: CRTAC1 family protein, partial [Cyanobacteria bacterium J06558_2]